MSFRAFLQCPTFQPTVSKIGIGILSVVALFPACEVSHHPDAANFEASAESPRNVSPLINADHLKSLLATNVKHVRILEPGKDQDAFSAGHLPSAQFVHWIDDMIDPENVSLYNNLRPDQFQDLMAQLGIENNDLVIIYDRMNSRLSTRLYWTCKRYGHQRVRILDGGFQVWNSKQNPITNNLVKVAASNYKIANAEDNILAKQEFVMAQMDEPDMRLVDGRPPKQYSGEEFGKVFHTDQEHPRKGHIPGSINVFWKDNFNRDGTFKSPQQLRELYRKSGIEPADQIVTYCNEGLHAAPPWFVLHELLGFERVRLYDSSMAEWANSAAPMKKAK